MNAPSTPTLPPAPTRPVTSGLVARQLAVDTAMRWAAFIAVIAVVVFAGAWAEAWIPNASIVVMMVVAAAWVSVGMVSTRVWQQLPRITAMVEQDPGSAEGAISDALRRRPLQRSVRLVLYHRLAVLRHRQQRFAEAAAICQAVLRQPLGRARNIRGNLLLMLAEARLECGDLPGAYAALRELHAEPLPLVESLQRLGLQTRYEVACGYDAAALAGFDQKLPLIELMPAPQCGAMHAMLTLAARRSGQSDLAGRLRRRAELLCSPEQLRAILGE